MKVGDKVYWKQYRKYMSPLTISGTIIEIKESIVTVMQTTQNTHGKIITKNINTLTLNKKQI